MVCLAHLPSTTSKAYKRSDHVKLADPKLSVIKRVGNIRKARSHYKFTNYINDIVHTKKYINGNIFLIHIRQGSGSISSRTNVLSMKVFFIVFACATF